MRQFMIILFLLFIPISSFALKGNIMSSDTLIPLFRNFELPYKVFAGKKAGALLDNTYLITKERMSFYNELHKSIIDSTSFAVCEKIINDYKSALDSTEYNLGRIYQLYHKKDSIHTKQMIYVQKTIYQQNMMISKQIQDLDKVKAKSDNLTKNLKNSSKRKIWRNLGIGTAGLITGIAIGLIL